jgi:hypothetical protein
MKVTRLTKRQTRILFKIFAVILQRLKEPNALGFSAMVLLLHALAHFLDEKGLLPQEMSIETDNAETHDRNELQHELWCAEMLG